MTEAVQVTALGQSSAQVNDEDLAALMAAAELPVEIEEATLSLAARTARLTIYLEDGHVWELECDPSTGIAVHPSLGFQAQLVPAMQAVIARYLD